MSKGQFQKGNNGKPKGAKSKVSIESRILLKEILDENLPQLKIEVKKLQGRDLIFAMFKLSEIVLPRLQKITLEEGDPDNENMTLKSFMKLNINERLNVAESLKNKK